MLKDLLTKGIWVKDRRKIRLIPYDTITHIHHHEGISEILMGKTLLKKVHVPLNKIEEKTLGTHFFRTHRNYLVNTALIDHSHPESPNSIYIHGEQIPVSRRRKKAFEKYVKTQN